MTHPSHVIMQRTEVDRLRRSVRAWKRCAKQYRAAFALASEFSDGWYRAYRRAWKLDEPVQGARPLMGFVYDFWRFARGLFFGPPSPPSSEVETPKRSEAK